jgi:ABC-type uncharacterized transport system involved in gliding motility auxiliary subunit
MTKRLKIKVPKVAYPRTFMNSSVSFIIESERSSLGNYLFIGQMSTQFSKNDIFLDLMSKGSVKLMTS